MTTPIGYSHLNQAHIHVESSARQKHMAVFGKSGVGKTTLLRNILTTDIRSGAGVTVIDPHGGLIEELLHAIPRHRTRDVIYLKPDHPTHVLGLNLLQSVAPNQRPLVVSSLVSAVRNIWPDSWGPRSEYILTHAAAALLEQPHPATLLALPKLLTDEQYRRRIAQNVNDPPVRAFFEQYERWTPRFRDEAISPVLNKVSKFITNPLLRAVLGQPTSSFDFRWLMDNRKILLCHLSKGSLGEDVSSLLGSLIVTKLSLAALSRQDIPEDQRQIHYLVADEVQNFIHGMDFPTILSEARKYRLALTIATQTLGQLPNQTRRAVFANCATVLAFRVSGEDAQSLDQEFATLISASALQELGDFKLYVRSLLRGDTTRPDPVSAYPPLPKAGNEKPPEELIRDSMVRYGRPRRRVEARLDRFLRS